MMKTTVKGIKRTVKRNNCSWYQLLFRTNKQDYCGLLRLFKQDHCRLLNAIIRRPAGGAERPTVKRDDYSFPSAVRNTRLRFRQWLNMQPLTFAKATIEVSTDGSTWRSLFASGYSGAADEAWRRMEYEIGTVADQQATVYVRWGHQRQHHRARE
ncbi:MAG: hypothetical protein KGS60_14100 [Verrucomicrobia bacterium]|nr:hypothetical protein [Verrucomicrobiota bacterium]